MNDLYRETHGTKDWNGYGIAIGHGVNPNPFQTGVNDDCLQPWG